GDFDNLSASRGEVIWINADCGRELELWNDRIRCSVGDADFSDFQTGVDGKETQVHWLVGTAPPPPHMRIIPGNHRVTIFWDNFSETTPDPSTQELDFEGYRIWRADNWHRPQGTSVLTGPPRALWQLVEERDLPNGVCADEDFRLPFAEGGWEYEPLPNLQGKEEYISMFEEALWYFPLDSVPCPPHLADTDCDTLEALARSRLGYEGGKRYYKFVDYNVHNGMHYFYSVTAFDHTLSREVPVRPGKYGDPASNFQYVVPVSDAQASSAYDEKEIYVVPNPATAESMAPWMLQPNMEDPTGIKIEFRNMPACFSTVRVYTLAGDLVTVLGHDGSGGNGSLPWDLVSRNGQNVTSGIYIYSVEPVNGAFAKKIGKFVIIR
ncbi:MAG: hypothetical protein JXB45_07400, partial [Candidatus Krumholzibacteriota bacterium]|nr:hypothetical protein [Candidatus Krumholzibacteriota bacterium]